MDGERRSDYPKILDTLDDIKTEMVETRLEAKRIAVLVEERNQSALVWRSDVCKKFDRQNEKIDSMAGKIEKLPCPQREEITKGVKKEQDKLWLFVNCIIVAIVTSWVGLVVTIMTIGIKK